MSTSAALDKLRKNLLDISVRNRLINAPLNNKRANALECVDELADEIFRLLWLEGRTFTFLSNPNEKAQDEDEEDEEAVDGFPVYLPPKDDEDDEQGVAARHADTKLQTRLYRETLQRRLISLSRDANLIEEEQGVNALFLGLGFVKWFDSPSSDIERFAPLILLPVALERDRVKSRMRLKRRADDIEINLSFAAKLQEDFDLILPDFSDEDEWSPSEYFERVSKVIEQKARWSVEPDRMLLGFYSFSKFLLYRDLDTAAWPESMPIADNTLVRDLLVDGFPEKPLEISETQNLDDILDPSDLGHVVNADASQAAVIKMAADGRNMVVQGPPGTGKSQSIANVIAAATRQGKTVLFVAEKMAALEVVFDRLRHVGLDPLCLELHSRKANKRSVVEELKRTLALGPVAGGASDIAAQTKSVRDQLNATSKLLHSPLAWSVETPFQVLSELVWLREMGATPTDFKVEDALIRSHEGHHTALSLLKQLSRRTSEAGPSNHHPWCGTVNRLTPMDMQRLMPKLMLVSQTIDTLQDLASQAGLLLDVLPEQNVPAMHIMSSQLKAIFDAPSASSEVMASGALRADPQKALGYLQSARDLQSQFAKVTQLSKAAALKVDWSETRQNIAMHGKSMFRFLNGAFKASVAMLDSVATQPPVKSYEGRLAFIDAIVDFQDASQNLATAEESAHACFGAAWRGQDTNVEPLQATLQWYLKNQTVLQEQVDVAVILQKKIDPERLITLSKELTNAADAFSTSWQELSQTLSLDEKAVFPDADSSQIDSVKKKVITWRANFERLDEWFGLHALEKECFAFGLQDFVVSLAKGDITADEIELVYRHARAEALWNLMLKEKPDLNDIRGVDREDLITDFKSLEDELFAVTSREILAKHAAEIPSGAQGQMGVIRGEIGKRRKHRSIRKLVTDAGDALQKIKPIFLMSPISVAQYLPPGRLTFDIILIDEASQVRPADSIGTIARGHSVVVVGDSKQLPPTSFFDRALSGSDEEEEDVNSELVAPSVDAGALESILTLCDARGMPSRTLQWHYRSRHPSLIQVSNDTFYDNKLKFPPSPQIAGHEGLLFTKTDGVYDRGKSRTNKIEAEQVAKAILKHAQSTPNLSLGVVTLSTAQRNIIEAELEILRADNPGLDSFFARSKHEPFFVKNLENVQGDERDVIFISIGYARDKTGFMSQAFGPVNSSGGERRLNVLFTRAKRRCEIFSSITESDVEIRGDKVPVGRRVLHAYLKFARTGETDVPVASDKDPDSVFEEAVIKRLREAGYSVDPQVGSSGFFIDMAVRNPDNSDAYVLGVECDGAAYHSARWARERDKLRQEVLESKGWRMHRIWGTDWFRKPDQEFQKLLTAIEQARVAQAARSEAEADAGREAIVIERETKKAGAMILSAPYKEASMRPLHGFAEPHLVPISKMAGLVKQIVSIEQPIHSDEIAKRVAKIWGLQRTGSRIKDAVLDALGKSKREEIVGSDGFWKLTGTVDVLVRDRSGVKSTTLRKPKYLPPEEVDQAVREAVVRNVSASSEEISREVSQAFGFKSTSAQLKLLVVDRLEALVASGALKHVAGQYAQDEA